VTIAVLRYRRIISYLCSMPPRNPSTGPSLFDVYAHEYDLLTDAAARESNHDREIEVLVNRFAPAGVLDAGCATGLTSMLFAKRGIRTVGYDRSRRMVEQAKKKFGDKDYDLQFKVGDFERIPKSMHGKFDLVVCLANSVAGLETRARLQRGLKNFREVLKPGGVLVIQMLNFGAIKEGQLFPIKATVNDGIIWERFFERRQSTYILYASRLDTNTIPPSLEIFRHQFDNFTRDEVIKALKFSRFTSMETYADLKLTSAFDRKKRDLVIVARNHP
jgi:SAM-dependent methyltransferase